MQLVKNDEVKTFDSSQFFFYNIYNQTKNPLIKTPLVSYHQHHREDVCVCGGGGGGGGGG